MSLRLNKSLEDSLLSIDTEGSWAISYGDMVTLLLTFFIIFFSIDAVRDRQEALEVSMMNNFLPKEEQGTSDVKKQEERSQKTGVETKRGVLTNWGAKMGKVGNRIIVEFPEISFFNSGQTELTKKGSRQLNVFAGNYIPFAGRYYLSVLAFTDSRRPTPNIRYKDNLELSALRAISAMRILQKSGLPLSRMRLGGYGEIRQAALDISTLNQTGFSLARKVVLVIEQDLSEE